MRITFHASPRHSSASSRKKSDVMQTLIISPLWILYSPCLFLDSGYLKPDVRYISAPSLFLIPSRKNI